MREGQPSASGNTDQLRLRGNGGYFLSGFGAKVRSQNICVGVQIRFVWMDRDI